MRWAVHWLHSESRIFYLKDEEVFRILVVMAWSFPKLQIEDVRWLNLLEPTDPILFSDQVHQLVINGCSMGIEETTSWRKFVHIEKLLLFADETMITLFCLLFEVDVFIHLLFSWEWDTVHSVKRIIGSFTKPVSRRVFHNFESFDHLAWWDMGSSTQINQVTASVGCHFHVICDFTAD